MFWSGIRRLARSTTQKSNRGAHDSTDSRRVYYSPRCWVHFLSYFDVHPSQKLVHLWDLMNMLARPAIIGMRFYEPRWKPKLSSALTNVSSLAARLFLQNLGEALPIYYIMDGRKLVPYQCVVRREVRTFQGIGRMENWGLEMIND